MKISSIPAMLLAASALLPGCKSEPPPAPAPAPTPEVAAPKPAEAAVASVSGKSDPECLGPIDTAVPEKLTLGGRQVEISGYALRVTSKPDADDQATIGVLANLNEASGENLFNIRRYLAFFKEHGAELVVVAGDSGEDKENLVRVLSAVADGGLPVIAIAGNRESRADFVDAMNVLRKQKPNVLNGNRIRYLDWDDVDLVTLPGYHDPRYIHAGSAGCQYFQQDLRALEKVVAEANHPVLLVAHGAPKGSAKTAVDVLSDGQNVGDENLTALITKSKIPFGIFPNIKEAAGFATSDVDGTTRLAEKTPSESLYLNPGSADSLAWTLNDGTTLAGAAAVVTVKGKQAIYRIYKAAKLSDAEKEQAARLAPAPATAEAAAKAP